MSEVRSMNQELEKCTKDESTCNRYDYNSRYVCTPRSAYSHHTNISVLWVVWKKQWMSVFHPLFFH